MKNYLVKTLFEVSDTDWKVHDRSHEPDLYNNYVKMHRVSLASYKRFLQGDWEFKFLGGKVEHINQAFEKTFWFIHDLWHQEPCNILYTDPDTLAIQPVNYWGEYDTFRMFNYTDPKEFHESNPYNKQFKHFFNAGVRYFPAAMSPDIWKAGADMARQWDPTTYNTEQIILNTMLWDQGVTSEQAFEPAKAWQMFSPDVEYCQGWNGCEIEKACVIHLHGSRDSKSRADFMQLYAERNQLEV